MNPLKCRLCKNNDASSIGSHIFNRELINWTINSDGTSNKTDNEALFTIRPGQGTSTFFGRKIGNDKVEKILGREMTDDEIETNKTQHTYVKKYFLCVNCENRLERVERYFMNNVYTKIKEGTFTAKSIMQDLDVVTFDTVNLELARLYIYSLVWRGLESKISLCYSPKWHKEVLRNILDENLHLDINTAIQNANQNRGFINRFPMIVSYLTTTQDASENFIFIAKSNCPYFFLIGDISIQLFFKNQSVLCHQHKLFGMRLFNKHTDIVNKGNSKFKISVISEPFRKNVLLRKLACFAVESEFLETKKDILSVWQKIFNKIPSKKVVNKLAAEVLIEYSDDSVPIGIRYSPKRKIEIYMRKIIEIALQKIAICNIKFIFFYMMLYKNAAPTR